MEPEVQMSLARRLVHDRRFDFCAKTLEVLIQDFPGEGPFMEKAFLMLARLYGQKLDAPRKAANVYEQFFRTFPQSQWREVVLREYEEVIGKWNAWEKGATEKSVATSCSCS
jgi:hypothetical protein